jgi:hypothetical protein
MKEIPGGQKPIFLGVDGVCLNLHNKTPSQTENTLHTHRGFERWKRKEEIRESISVTCQTSAKQAKN